MIKTEEQRNYFQSFGFALAKCLVMHQLTTSTAVLEAVKNFAAFCVLRLQRFVRILIRACDSQEWRIRGDLENQVLRTSRNVRSQRV